MTCVVYIVVVVHGGGAGACCGLLVVAFGLFWCPGYNVDVYRGGHFGTRILILESVCFLFLVLECIGRSMRFWL